MKCILQTGRSNLPVISPNGLFYHNSSDRSVSNSRVSVLIEITVFNANSVDPDQMPRFAASDLCLHFLPIILLGVSRLKWVNTMQ